MAKERRKVIQAGRLWMAVQYSNIRTDDPGARREARQQISTPARESLNAKMSWQKLMLILATNFKSDDLVVTLTYRDKDLPRRREDADRCLSNFIRHLRASRRSGTPPRELPYVRVTEGYHSGGRLHHHLIIDNTGADFETVRNLWSKYGDNVDFERFGADGAERWAKYLTKEPREKGRRHIGDRSWRTSKGMAKPITSYEFVSPADGLLPPPGAMITDRAECENSFGRFHYILALLPEKTTE